jgi:hypothetical protein
LRHYAIYKFFGCRKLDIESPLTSTSRPTQKWRRIWRKLGFCHAIRACFVANLGGTEFAPFQQSRICGETAEAGLTVESEFNG